MTSRSKVLPYDIFYSKRHKHYFICVYTQELDNSHRLNTDLYGVIVTTNKKYNHVRDRYVVPTMINGVESFIRCDTLTRIDSIISEIEVKQAKLTFEEREEVNEKVKTFTNEILRQIGGLN